MPTFARRHALKHLSALVFCGGLWSSAHAGFMSTDVTKVPVSVAPLTVIVPADPNIVHSLKGLIRDVGQPERWVRAVRNDKAMQYEVRNEQLTPEEFVVHARISNGTAGSGVKYTVRYQVTEQPDGAYAIQFTPVDRGTYQQGLIGKFNVPDFIDSDVRTHMLTDALAYKFEINSSYAPESVNANFLRLANPVSKRTSEPDEVSGKIFKNYFAVPFGAKRMQFTIEVYPYRNGSKVVAYARVPALETSPDIVDYTVLLSNARKQLEAIAQD